MELQRIRMLNKEELLQALKENEFGAVANILQDREIAVETFIDLKEFEIFRWKLGLTQKKELWSCLNQIRQKPSILLKSENMVKAAVSLREGKPNLLKTQIEHLLGPAEVGTLADVSQHQVYPSNRVNTNTQVFNRTNRSPSDTLKGKVLPFLLPPAIEEKAVLPVSTDNSRNRAIYENLGPHPSSSILSDFENMTMANEHQDNETNYYSTLNEGSEENVRNTKMMPTEIHVHELPNKETQTLPNKNSFGRGKLPSVSTLQTIQNQSEDNESEVHTDELPIEDNNTPLPRSSSNAMSLDSLVHSKKISMDKSKENLNIWICNEKLASTMDRNNKDFDQFPKNCSPTNNAQEPTTQNKKISIFTSLFKPCNKLKTTYSDNIVSKTKKIMNRPLPEIPAVSKEADEPESRKLFSKPLATPTNLPRIKDTGLESEDTEAEEIYENSSIEGHLCKDTLLAKEPLPLSTSKTSMLQMKAKSDATDAYLPEFNIRSQRRNSGSQMSTSFRNESALANTESTYSNANDSIKIHLPLPSIPDVILPLNKVVSKYPLPRQGSQKNIDTLVSTDDEKEYGNIHAPISKKATPMPNANVKPKHGSHMFADDEKTLYSNIGIHRNGSEGSTFKKALPKPPALKPLISLKQSKVDLMLSNDSTSDDDEAYYKQAISYTGTENPYYRDTTREGAKLLLESAPNGSFLFRRPGKSSTSYILVLSVKHNNTLYNLGIEKVANKIRLNSCKNSVAPEFTTLSEFVNHFKTEPITILEKNKVVEFYLQHICY